MCVTRRHRPPTGTWALLERGLSGVPHARVRVLVVRSNIPSGREYVYMGGRVWAGLRGAQSHLAPAALLLSLLPRTLAACPRGPSRRCGLAAAPHGSQPDHRATVGAWWVHTVSGASIWPYCTGIRTLILEALAERHQWGCPRTGGAHSRAQTEPPHVARRESRPINNNDSLLETLACKPMNALERMPLA